MLILKLMLTAAVTRRPANVSGLASAPMATGTTRRDVRRPRSRRDVRTCRVKRRGVRFLSAPSQEHRRDREQNNRTHSGSSRHYSDHHALREEGQRPASSSFTCNWGRSHPCLALLTSCGISLSHIPVHPRRFQPGPRPVQIRTKGQVSPDPAHTLY